MIKRLLARFPDARGIVVGLLAAGLVLLGYHLYLDHMAHHQLVQAVNLLLQERQARLPPPSPTGPPPVLPTPEKPAFEK